MNIVITTINEFDKTCVNSYIELSCNIVIVGDLKTPYESYENKNLKYIYPDNELYNDFSRLLPYNHYCRKNIGYLYSINNNSKVIFDTDDDNYPIKNISTLNNLIDNSKTIYGQKFPNILSMYTDIEIWPRGYPLEFLSDMKEIETRDSSDYEKKSIGIIQSISNGEADLDAIYRLTNKNYSDKIEFDKDKTFIFEKGVYTQGNTQCTLWMDKELFFLLYIPSTVSFRFCDILKMYIAQRCMWEYDKLFCYISPIVKQDRNEHNLMNDFISEYPMYTSILCLVNNIFDKLTLYGNKNDLMIVYNELYINKIVREEELSIVNEWLKNIP